MINASAVIRGLAIGPGTPFRFSKWPTGLLGTAGVREVDVPRPRRDGSVAGDDLLGDRRVTFEILILGTSRADAEANCALLSAAFAPSRADEWFDVRVTGNPAEYALRGRCRGANIVMGRRFNGGVAEARCTFVATDPLRYGPPRSEELGLAAHTIPATLPFILGLYSTTTIHVGGNAAVQRWTITFRAPSGGSLIRPRIQHVDVAQILQVDATVPADDQLVLDGYSGTASLGAADPEFVATSVSQWFELAAGPNVLRFSAADGSHLSSTATVEWRPGWL